MLARSPRTQILGAALTAFAAAALLVGGVDLLAAVFPGPGWPVYLLLALLSYLLLALPAGLALGILALLLRLDRAQASRLAITVVAAAAGIALAFLRWLPEAVEIASPAGVAVLLLILLAAWGCGRLLAPLSPLARPYSFWRALAAGCLLLSLWAWFAGAPARRWEPARSRAAARPATRERPSVLLIVLDTLRADRLGVYGNRDGLTPTLDRLAREGVTFLDACSSAPYTPPAHASLLTGDYPCRHGVGGGRHVLSARSVTLAEYFSSSGYATFGVAANAFLSASLGWDQGFDTYDEQRWGDARFTDWFARTPATLLLEKANLQPRRWLLLAGLKSGLIGSVTAEQTVDHLLAALAWAAPRRFFGFVNFMDPHYPYTAPDVADDAAVSVANRAVLPVVRSHTHSLVAHPDARPVLPDLLRAYDSEVRYLDRQLGRLFAELRERDLLRHTWIVVTADHGEQFGEHDLLLHANSLYAPLLQIPLIIRPPDALMGVERGRVLPAPLVSIVDIPVTLLDLAGIDSPQTLPGVSLRALLEGTTSDTAGSEQQVRRPPLRAVAAERNEERVILWDRYKAFFAVDSLLRVIDRRDDRGEARDLLPRTPGLAAEARRVDAEWRRRADSGERLGSDADIDPLLRERLRTLGYLQ
jgi:arylsulfatase A-like enzyme